MLRLPVEGTLSEDRAEQTAILKVSLDVVQNLRFRVGGTADDDNIRTGNDVPRLV